MITGRRNSEIRSLKWGDFDIGRKGSSLASPNSQTILVNQASAKIFYRWSGKGKDRRDEGPRSLWRAITDFLKVSDRLDTIANDDYIFTPLSYRAAYLPNEDPRNLHQNRKLTMRQVGKRLNAYADRASLLQVSPTYCPDNSSRTKNPRPCR